MVESDVCIWCNEEIETLPHIMLECEVVKQFWKQLKQWIFSKNNIMYHIQNKEIILGIPIKELDLLNKLYLFGKRYIYIRKNKNMFIDLDSFIVYLTRLLNIEKELAISKNKLTEFLSLWDVFL